MDREWLLIAMHMTKFNEMDERENQMIQRK